MFKSHSEKVELIHSIRSRIRSSTLVLLAVGFGCSTMGSLEPMEVTLKDLVVTEMTVFETSLLAKLRITNPNPDPITIDGASFKLYIEDKKVGTGTTKESFALDRLDSNVIEVVFHINNASALLRLKEIFGNNDVSYGVRGALFTEGAFGTKKIRIEKTGHVDLSGANPQGIFGSADDASSPSPEITT
jgi:LEA14-like dessication related protein